VEEIQELANGCAFRLPSDSDILMLAAEDLNMERLCCPFMRYTLELEPNRGPFWLRFTVGAGVKEYLRMAVEEANLFDEHVAKAAGFNVAARTDIDSVDTVIGNYRPDQSEFAQAYAPSIED
jgi:hypothetical protein